MLKLKQLRQEAYSAWETLYLVKGLYTGAPQSMDVPEAEGEKLPWINETFKAEIRKDYGDLRYRRTWESAAIQLMAHMMVQSYLEPYQIVGYMASPDYMNCAIRQHYGERLIDAMLAFPEILEIVKAGLEQLYQEPQKSENRDIAQTFLKQCASRLPVASVQLLE